MIRSTKTSLKFANKVKKESLEKFLDEYKRVTQEFVNLLWNQEKIPNLLPKETTDKIQTWLSARMVQCAGKQASGIVRGTLQKNKQRQYIYEKLLKENQIRKAKKLQKIIDQTKMSCPILKTLEAELDSRFVLVDFNDRTTFDGWITLGSIGNKIKLILPFNQHKHFNKLKKAGKLTGGLRISSREATFMFGIPEKPKSKGKTIGIDVGSKSVLSVSNGFQTKRDIHGWSLDKIQTKLCRKQKGSKGFRKAQEHRKNFVNWSVNQLNLKNVSKIKLEKIKNLRKGKRTSRFLNSWTYTEIFGKLERYCEEQGVLVEQVNPTYTSQRCSVCGWVRKTNRKGLIFKCTSCGNSMDADLNAAKNISLDLPEISRKDRLKQINRTGFYWLAEGQEHIVPVTTKTNLLIFA